MKIGLIDYGAGNLRSVETTLNSVGYQPSLVSDPNQLDDLTHLILPGVGAFGDCSRKLRSQGLADPIKAWIAEDRPFFGICVGLQILMEESEESPGEPGLGIFKGQVKRFQSNELKIPHMGWNPLNILDEADPIWCEIPQSPHFYFVHSYYAEPVDCDIVSATCSYGINFCAAVRFGNLFATQFHPEKSQALGSRLLKGFLETPFVGSIS